MKKQTIICFLFAVSLALVTAQANSDTLKKLRSKPWTSPSCMEPVKNAAPLFQKFKTNVASNNTEEICKDVRELRQPLINISKGCEIGTFVDADAIGKRNITEILSKANTLLPYAERVVGFNPNATSVNDVAADIEKLIELYPKLSTECDFQ